MGANGYLGQYLARALAEAGRECVLHSRTAASGFCKESGLPFVQEDLVESRRALSGLEPETVYLLARPATEDAGVFLDFAQNVQWLLQEWADRGCLQRVVFASTQLVYATPVDDVPLVVTSPLGPETAYDCHKAEMEFFLALLAHHKSGVRAELYRLPLLAGRAEAEGRHGEQYLFQWRAEYQRGLRWEFPEGDGPHRKWGTSWVHVDDVVALMASPREGDARLKMVQPVSGHLTYEAMDAFFRARYALPEKAGSIHLPQTAFYLEDNAGCGPRAIEEAFMENAEAADARGSR